VSEPILVETADPEHEKCVLTTHERLCDRGARWLVRGPVDYDQTYLVCDDHLATACDIVEEIPGPRMPSWR
jgi:hypothetical protein